MFGAAAAAGCAASLIAQQMRWLLDYAAQQSSGIAAWQRDTDHIEKAFVFGGMPARSGVTSALLVQAGWNGVDDIFSGENNFLIANAPEADPAHLPTELVDKLGDRYEVLGPTSRSGPWDRRSRRRSTRSRSCCSVSGSRADQVKEVVVRVTRAGHVVDNRDMPDICLQHMMAVMLVDGTASFASAHDKARMKDRGDRAAPRQGPADARDELEQIVAARRRSSR